MLMYKGKQVVDTHPSEIDTMINRGWSKSAPTAKPKKATVNKEADHG